MEKSTSAILVVDDEPLNLKLLRRFLVPCGTRVEEASSGEDELEKAKEKPDLILPDILMPGMNGFETCRLIKGNDRTEDMPVIFLSALQDEKAEPSGLEVGGVDCVANLVNRFKDCAKKGEVEKGKYPRVELFLPACDVRPHDRIFREERHCCVPIFDGPRDLSSRFRFSI